MNMKEIIGILKVLKMVATYKLDVEKIIKYTEEQFGRGAAMKLADVIRQMNTNNDGSVDLIEALMYIIRKIKK